MKITTLQPQRVTTRLSAPVKRVSYMQSSTSSSGTIDSNTQANYTNYSQADQTTAPDDTQQAWWQKPAAIITGLIATVGLAFAGWKLRKPNPIETASNNKKDAANPLGETKSGEKSEEKPTIDIPDFGFFGDTKKLLEKIVKDFKPSDFEGKEVKVFNQANTAEAICVVPFKDALEIISLEIKLADSSINNEDKHRLQELRQIHKLNKKGEWLKFAASFIKHSADFKVQKLFAEVKDKLISELPNVPTDQIEKLLNAWFQSSEYSGDYIGNNFRDILEDKLNESIRFNIENGVKDSESWKQIVGDMNQEKKPYFDNPQSIVNPARQPVLRLDEALTITERMGQQEQLEGSDPKIIDGYKVRIGNFLIVDQSLLTKLPSLQVTKNGTSQTLSGQEILEIIKDEQHVSFNNKEDLLNAKRKRRTNALGSDPEVIMCQILPHAEAFLMDNKTAVHNFLREHISKIQQIIEANPNLKEVKTASTKTTGQSFQHKLTEIKLSSGNYFESQSLNGQEVLEEYKKACDFITSIQELKHPSEFVKAFINSNYSSYKDKPFAQQSYTAMLANDITRNSKMTWILDPFARAMKRYATYLNTATFVTLGT